MSDIPVVKWRIHTGFPQNPFTAFRNSGYDSAYERRAKDGPPSTVLTWQVVPADMTLIPAVFPQWMLNFRYKTNGSTTGTTPPGTPPLQNQPDR
jgi:hypothetical protein